MMDGYSEERVEKALEEVEMMRAGEKPKKSAWDLHDELEREEAVNDKRSDAEMDAERFEAIRKRADAATKGPWEVDGEGDILNRKGQYVVFASHGSYYSFLDMKDSDEEFIVNAREDIPALLAEVERLRASVDMAKNIVGNLTRENAILKGEKPITVRLNGGEIE